MILRSLPLFCLLLLATGSDAAVFLERLAPLHRPAVGELVEWRLKSAPAEWVVNDVTQTPWLRVTAPDGSTIRRRAFRYRPFQTAPASNAAEFERIGDDELRLRHSFRSVGEHQWELFAPGGARDAQPLSRGSVLVGDSGRPSGPIRISPHNQRLLSYAGGEPYLAIGPNIAWAVDKDRIARFNLYLDRLTEAGGTHARVWCASWFGQIEGPQQFDFRLDQAWLLDQALAAARARGIHVTLVLDNHHDFQHGHNLPYGDTLEERITTFFNAQLPEAYRARLRYILARYGADDAILAWEFFNEIDLTTAPRWRVALWTDAVATFLEGADPDGRLTTISLSDIDWPEVQYSPKLDLVQVHRYVPYLPDAEPKDEDGVGIMLSEGPALLKSDRPFLFAEVGHQGTNEDNPGNQGDHDGFLLRQQAWAGLLMGGYGSGAAWWWDVYIEPKQLWQIYRPLVDVSSRLDWTDPKLRPLAVNADSPLRIIGWHSPEQALIWPELRGDTWWARREQGVERTTTTAKPMAVRLTAMQPDSTYAVTGFDMVDGSVRQFSTLRSDADGRLQMELPRMVADLVLLIQRK